jgi:hypothetical protein
MQCDDGCPCPAIFLKPEVDQLAALEKHQRDAASVQEPVPVDDAYERRLRRWSLTQVTLLIVAHLRHGGTHIQ